MRREREQVGLAPQRFERIAGHLAGKAHAPGDPQFLRQCRQGARMDRIALRRTHDGQVPVQIEQPCDSARSSTSWPLRGTSVPMERMWQVGPPDP